MTSDSMDDGVIERMVGDLRAMDRLPGPDPVFAMGLERSLRSGFSGKARHRGFAWQRISLGWPNLVHAATVALVFAIVGATVLSTWDRGSGGSGGVVPAASSVADDSVVAQSSPGAVATPSEPDPIPTAEELMAMCDLQRRADGQTQAMLDATTWTVTTSMPFVGISYPLYVGDALDTYQPLDPEITDQLNIVLQRLYACSVRDIGDGLIDTPSQTPRSDGYYFANYSDNYLRRARQRTSIWPWETWLPIPTILDDLGNDPQLTIVDSWDEHDWDVPRVAAYVVNETTQSTDPPGSTGYLMTFVQVDGVWEIDEVSMATIDAYKSPTNVSLPPSRVGDLMLFDHGKNPIDANMDFYAPGAFGPYEQGVGGMLRIFNFSSVEQTVTIADLGIAVTIEPGGASTVMIDGEEGRHTLTVSPLEGASMLEVQIVPAGTRIEPRG